MLQLLSPKLKITHQGLFPTLKLKKSEWLKIWKQLIKQNQKDLKSLFLIINWMLSLY